jgi:hypothetical protein
MNPEHPALTSLVLIVTLHSFISTVSSQTTQPPKTTPSSDGAVSNSPPIAAFIVLGIVCALFFLRVFIVFWIQTAKEGSCFYKVHERKYWKCLRILLCGFNPVPRQSRERQVQPNNNINTEVQEVKTPVIKLEDIKFEMMPPAMICIVCSERKKETYFEPCKHVCCCLKCAQLVAKKQTKCPVCRNEIVGIEIAHL